MRVSGGLAVCLSACWLSALPVAAQQLSLDAQVAALVHTLPAESQTVIARLEACGTLPAGEWRTHAGDVPHAEDPAFDDSAWSSVAPGSHAGVDAVWYRRWIEVPRNLNGYDLAGARVWFRFDASANGPITQILYFNGRRVALGDDLEPIVLFDHARPAEKVLVAVKLLPTVDDKSFNDVNLRIEFAAERPSPADLRAEFLSAAALLPGLSRDVQADRSVLEQAIAMVDLQALAVRNQSRFDASLRAAHAHLAPLQPVLQQATFYETGNSHIDAAWLWPWTETVDVVKRTFSSALQLMDEYPWFTFTQSAAAYNDWMASKYPVINAGIGQRIREGRWEIVGGMWVEPDLNMPDGEAEARSLLLGKRFFAQQYGVDVRIGWNPDSFGYGWQTPQIYKKSGIDYFVTQKMAWNDTNQLPFKLFWWQSPDGSRVLSYFPHEYGNTRLDPVRLSIDLAAARTAAPGLTEMMDLYGVGDHGGGPTRATLDEGAHWADGSRIVPHYRFGTAGSYFSAVEPKIAQSSPVWDYERLAQGYHPPEAPPAAQIAIPTMRSELYFEYHRGVFTTQANHKRNLRQSEEQALDAEKYASLAWLGGVDYPGADFTRIWQQVTFNDFHDLAAGSGIRVIYDEAQRDFDAIRLSTREIAARSLAALAARVDTTGAGVPILLFNPLGWQRSGLFEVEVQLPVASDGISILDAQHHVLPAQVLASDRTTGRYRLRIQAPAVPSLGYEILHAVPGQPHVASDLKARGMTLENDFLRVSIDPSTGCITSLFDKVARFEALAPGACGNELQAFKDTPKDYDAWNIDPGTLDAAPTHLSTADSVQLIEQGPLRSAIRVSRSWSKSKFVQDIELYAGAKQVNVVNDIDWHEDHVLLKVAYPLAATSSSATYEIPFGSIQRPTTRRNSWEQAQFEVPALRWADLGDAQHGFSLINESKYGYDARDNVLRLSLLRSPTWPDPTADRGHHHFSYALYPHAGDWKQALTVRRGYEYNYPLTALQVAAHSGPLPPVYSFVTVRPQNVVLTAMKKAEDADGLELHMYEWAGQGGDVDIAVPPGARSALVTNLLEQPAGPALAPIDGHVVVPIKPYEILAVRVDYPQSARHGNVP
jgi:alpha-mannosidase